MTKSDQVLAIPVVRSTRVVSHTFAAQVDALSATYLRLRPAEHTGGRPEPAESARFVDLVESGHGQDFAHSENRSKKVEERVGVDANLLGEGELPLMDNGIVGLEALLVAGHRYLDAVVFEVLEQAVALGWLTDPTVRTVRGCTGCW